MALGAQQAHPDGLEEDVGESEDEQVLHRLLSEEVVDPEDLVLAKVAVEDLVEFDRAGEIASERLLDDEAAVGGESDASEAGGDVVEQRRWDRHEEHRQLGIAKLLGDEVVDGWVLVVALDIAQVGAEPVDDRFVSTLKDLTDVIDESLIGPLAARGADDGHVEPALGREFVERRNQLVLCQVTGDAEQHQRIGLVTVHPLNSSSRDGHRTACASPRAPSRRSRSCRGWRSARAARR